VTWGRTKDAGKETTVCRRVLSARWRAIHRLQQCVLRLMSVVTWGLIRDAGWEIIACLKDQPVLLFAISLYLQFAMLTI